jgi:hypothetical protein
MGVLAAWSSVGGPSEESQEIGINIEGKSARGNAVCANMELSEDELDRKKTEEKGTTHFCRPGAGTWRWR